MTGRHHHGAAPSFCFRESIKDLKDFKDFKDFKVPSSKPHPTPYYIYKGQGKETYLPPPSSKIPLHPPFYCTNTMQVCKGKCFFIKIICPCQ